jgi:WD40 repeat protein
VNGLAGIKHNVLPVWSVAWSPDGKYVSNGSGAYEQLSPGTVIVWSTSSPKNRAIRAGPGTPVTPTPT